MGILRNNFAKIYEFIFRKFREIFKTISSKFCVLRNFAMLFRSHLRAKEVKESKTAAMKTAR